MAVFQFSFGAGKHYGHGRFGGISLSGAVVERLALVERTRAWLSRCRRLSKDYEERTDSSEAWVRIAMVILMLKRLQPA